MFCLQLTEHWIICLQGNETIFHMIENQMRTVCTPISVKIGNIVQYGMYSPDIFQDCISLTIAFIKTFVIHQKISKTS